jgi:hypothetical protein
MKYGHYDQGVLGGVEVIVSGKQPEDVLQVKPPCL